MTPSFLGQPRQPYLEGKGGAEEHSDWETVHAGSLERDPRDAFTGRMSNWTLTIADADIRCFRDLQDTCNAFGKIHVPNLTIRRPTQPYDDHACGNEAAHRYSTYSGRLQDSGSGIAPSERGLYWTSFENACENDFRWLQVAPNQSHSKGRYQARTVPYWFFSTPSPSLEPQTYCCHHMYAS